MGTMMVSPALEVVDLGSAPPLPVEVERTVAEVWRRCSGERPGLHDGEVFSVASVSPTQITGWFVPYRHFIAQCTNEGLAELLEVAPLAVTGRTVTADGRIVVAKRGLWVTQDPGAWELAPAGGVDRSARRGGGQVDLGVALRSELGEELGLSDHHIARMRPLALVVDPADRVHDVVVEVYLRISTKEVMAQFERRGSEEYSDLRLVPVEDLVESFQSDRRAAGFDTMARLPMGV